MMKKRTPARTLAILSMLVAVAMLLSYIEHLIPPLVAVPGVKLGLANVASVFALYILGRKYAVAVSLVRVLLSSVLFGNPAAFIYAFSGAVLALLGMCLLKSVPFLSEVGVSVVGAVLHNVGQIAAAAVVMRTGEIILIYLPPLIATGTVAGVVIGIASGLLVRRLKNKI